MVQLVSAFVTLPKCHGHVTPRSGTARASTCGQESVRRSWTRQMLLAGKGGSVEHIVGPFYGPLKEVSPAGTSGLITNTVRPESRWSIESVSAAQTANM